MKEFLHLDASTVSEAVSLLERNEGQAKIIAGGSELLSRMKYRISPTYPEVLVNIKTIPDMDYIKEEGGVLKIGSLARLSDVANNSTVKDRYTALAEAANRVATPQIRNMGTIAGNLSQEVRCWYYRAELNRFHCLRKGGTLCYAMLGNNKYNSIFGAVGGCIAINPSDTAPALVALNAEVKTSKRTIAIEEFFSAENGEKTTVLDDNEIVTEIQVPTPATGTKSAFVKFAIRKSLDFAIGSCAAAITSAAGTVTAARICLNAVHNNPRRATEAEDSITGKAISESTAEDAGSAAVSNNVPLPYNKYMVQIAKTMVKRAILAAK